MLPMKSESTLLEDDFGNRCAVGNQALEQRHTAHRSTFVIPSSAVDDVRGSADNRDGACFIVVAASYW